MLRHRLRCRCRALWQRDGLYEALLLQRLPEAPADPQPSHVHLFTDNHGYFRFRSVSFFYETFVVFVKLGMSIAVRILFPVLDPAISKIHFAGFRMDTVVPVLKIRFRDVFAFQVQRRLEKSFHFMRSHTSKFCQGNPRLVEPF